MKTFIPITDDNQEHIPALSDRLVPYQVGYGNRRFQQHDCQVTPADLQVQIPAAPTTPNQNPFNSTGGVE